jgi:hypothetical protein
VLVGHWQPALVAEAAVEVVVEEEEEPILE